MQPLPSRLVSSVRLAATSGQGRTMGELAAAFEDGLWAARHGYRIPPFVLLDVRTILSDFAAGRSLVVPQRAPSPNGYDEWLMSLARGLSRRLGRTTLGTLATTTGDGAWAVGPHLPVLLSIWPKVGESSRDWIETYRFLTADPVQFREAQANWISTRQTQPESWWEWPIPTLTPSPESLLLARFAADQPGEQLFQQFDHAAAELYLRARDPAIPDRFEARLDDELETLSVRDRPITESFEEQHPFVGAPTIYTYTLGEYGLFKLVNRSDPRLSTPPRASKPQTFEVHLVWTLGFRGLRTPVGSPRGVNQADTLVAESTLQASVLQGLVALLLDDWRASLRRQRVTFHLHRAGVSPDEWKPRSGSPIRNITAGRRWKDELLTATEDRAASSNVESDAATLPPFGVMGLLFRKVSVLDAGPVMWDFGRRGEPQPDAGKWWCGVILRSELEHELDFRTSGETPGQKGSDSVPVWHGPAKNLPRALQHLIVVDPALRTGWVYAVDASASRGNLRPVAQVTAEETPSSDSYLTLRKTALATLAEVLLQLAPV